MIRKVSFPKAFLAGVAGSALWELVFRSLKLAWPLRFDMTNSLGTLILPSSSPFVWPLGMSVHLAVGGIWAIFYAYFFWSNLKLPPVYQGMIFSLVPSIAASLSLSPQMAVMHPLAADPNFSSPGFFGLNWGLEGPLSIFGFHLLYGWTLGLLYRKPVGSSLKKERKPLRWRSPKNKSVSVLIPPPQPGDFFFCTGIECSYPRIDHGRWRMDELELTRHYDYWEKDLEIVAQMGIRYLRYGPPLHRIFRGPDFYDWSFTDAVLGRIRELGIIPIIDLCHFGLPEWIGDFQNHDLPGHLARYARAMAERYPWIRFWNPVNEIYVAARESTLQGNWNEALKSERAFVRAITNMVKASHEVMNTILEIQPQAVFITSESSEFYQACCPSAKVQAIADFENQRRFIPTDLLYSHPVRADILQYLLEHGMTREEYDRFMGAGLAPRMIMGLDYYEWNEKLVNSEGEIERLGELFGWYVITKQYYDRYQRPLFHSETNSQDARQGAGWLWRQWHNINLLLKEGIPVIGFTWYSLQDQIDWDIGLSEPRGNVNPVGLFDLNRDARYAAVAYKQILQMYSNQKMDPNVAREYGL